MSRFFGTLLIIDFMNQSSSNNSNADSVFAELISEHRRMKKSAFVFTIAPIICCGLGIFFIGGSIYSIGSMKEVVSGLILALVFFACGLPLWIINRRERDLNLRTFADGLIYRRNNRKSAARWEDVAEIFETVEYRSVNGIPVGSFYTYIIKLKNGREITTSQSLAGMEIFSRTMRGQLFPRLFVEAVQRYNSGAEVNFGEIAVNQSGITYQQKFLPQNALQAVQIADGYLKIVGADGKKAWATVSLAKIPNNFVLMALLEDIFKI